MGLYSYITIIILAYLASVNHSWAARYAVVNNPFDTVPSDSLKSRTFISDSLGRFSFNGEIRVEAQYSETKDLFQDIPANYLRTFVQTDMTLMGLPFQFGVIYSTENNNYHKINGIRLNFSNEKFLNNLRKQMVNRSTDLKYASELDSLQKEHFKLQSDIIAIDKEFSSPQYQNQLSLSAEITSEYHISDSLKNPVPGYRYTESKEFIKRHQTKISQLAKAKARIRQIEARQHDIKIIKQNSLSNHADEGRMKKLAKEKVPFLHRIAMDVKTFEAGKLTPAYNSLLLDGTSLNGVNIEVNPGIVYGGFVYGSLEYIFNSSRPGEYISPRQTLLNKNTNVLWFRAGIRNGKNLSVVFNQLIADIGLKQGEQYSNYRNMIVGADILYQHKNHNFRLEMAQSTYGTTNSFVKGLKNINSGSDYNYAIKSFYNVTLLKSHQLNLTARTSYVAPDYFGICVPFLRKDNFKLELGSGASFFKKMIRLETGLRTEKDNFYQKAPVTNNIAVYNLGIAFRYKKYPFIHLQVSPGYNNIFSLADRVHYTQEFSIYSLSTGYAHTIKKNNYSLTAFTGYSSYMQLFTSDSFSYNKNYQAGIAFNSLLAKAGIELTSTATLATVATGVNQVLTDSRISKIFGNYSIGTGYMYTKDPWKNIAELYYTTFSGTLPFNLFINLKTGYTYITRIDPVYIGRTDGLQVNMNISKKF